MSRLIHGARLSLTVGLAATALNVVVAVLIDGTAGFIGGRLDLVTRRLIPGTGPPSDSKADPYSWDVINDLHGNDRTDGVVVSTDGDAGRTAADGSGGRQRCVTDVYGAAGTDLARKLAQRVQQLGAAGPRTDGRPFLDLLDPPCLTCSSKYPASSSTETGSVPRQPMRSGSALLGHPHRQILVPGILACHPARRRSGPLEAAGVRSTLSREVVLTG